jgi:hypothetical protein
MPLPPSLNHDKLSESALAIHLKRMEDRGFSEVDLRRMLEHASGHRPDIVEGRFIIDARPVSPGKSL